MRVVVRIVEGQYRHIHVRLKFSVYINDENHQVFLNKKIYYVHDIL